MSTAERPVVPLPMFPLGTVLFPHAGLPLHVFEPRYRRLVQDCLSGVPEFGIVLIERGSEVGGGDSRFRVGTVARLVETAELPGGRWALIVSGSRRVRVISWLPDDPYPVAMVQEWPDESERAGTVEAPAAGEGVGTALAEAERRVRRALALAAEAAVPGVAPATFPLEAEEEVAAWQLCAVAPLGAVDRQKLLEAPAAGARLGLLADLAAVASEMLAYRLAAG